MMKRIKFAGAAVALALAAMPGAALAATAVSGLEGGSIGTSEQTRGFAFELTDAIRITGLGYFDEDADGLGASHQVGIWNAAGALLVSGTVGAGTANTLADSFRYTDLLTGTLNLAAGRYFVGGKSERVDGNYRQATSALYGPNLTFLGATTNDAVSFSAPTTATPGFDIGYFGANFTYDVRSAIPEPATWAMMIAGFGLAGGMLRTASRRGQLAATA